MKPEFALEDGSLGGFSLTSFFGAFFFEDLLPIFSLAKVLGRSLLSCASAFVFDEISRLEKGVQTEARQGGWGL